MIKDIQIANKGTRPHDFKYEDVKVIHARRGQFYLGVGNTYPPIASVMHDNTDEKGDIEIAINLAMQKLIGD